MQQLLLLLSFSLSRNISSNKRGAQEGPELLRRRNGNFFSMKCHQKAKNFISVNISQFITSVSCWCIFPSSFYVFTIQSRRRPNRIFSRLRVFVCARLTTKKNPRRKIPLKVGASVAVIRYVVVNGGAGYLNLSKAYLGGLLRRLT